MAGAESPACRAVSRHCCAPQCMACRHMETLQSQKDQARFGLADAGIRLKLTAKCCTHCGGQHGRFVWLPPSHARPRKRTCRELPELRGGKPLDVGQQQSAARDHRSTHSSQTAWQDEFLVIFRRQSLQGFTASSAITCAPSAAPEGVLRRLLVVMQRVPLDDGLEAQQVRPVTKAKTRY